MVDMSLHRRGIVVRLQTDADSIAVLMDPSEALTIGRALAEYGTPD
jgi:hypothetical protein